jgi:ornithine cyclodeaminase
MMRAVRFLSRRDVEALLDPDRLIEALASAMTDVSSGRASIPPRVAAMVDEREAILGAMPGYLPSSNRLAAKLVSVFPHNDSLGIPSHQAVIAVFDAETGTPAAIMDGTAITALRTAAGSALSTRLLARDDASVLAILGTGVQAHAHATIVPRARPIAEIRVAGRDPAKARALAEELRARTPRDDVTVVVAETFAQAMRGAHVVCATTHSPEPVIHRRSVEDGMHLTSVGVNRDGPEVDAETVRDSLVVVESRSAALAPFPAGAADLLRPIEQGIIAADHIHAEIGELVLGTKPGRTSPDQITLYKSVGIAAQDAAAAGLVLAEADRRGVGLRVNL